MPWDSVDKARDEDVTERRREPRRRWNILRGRRMGDLNKRVPRVHRFESTGDAYDSSQTACFCPLDHELGTDGHMVADGDVLVVEGEAAVAVLVEAWPVAIVEAECGKFHRHSDDWDWSAVVRTAGAGKRDYSESRALALEEWARIHH